MDLNELKIDSPETYAEAVEAGVKKEQERVDRKSTRLNSSHTT